MKILLLAALLCGLAACSSKSNRPNAVAACPRQEVYLYADNYSYLDTLANLTLTVDDSLLLAQPIPRNRLSSNHFVKMVRLCQGTHQVRVHFGRYAQDATFTITQESSLLTGMRYGTIRGLESENGVEAIILVRDGSPAID
jgi:hypothetical protein